MISLWSSLTQHILIIKSIIDKSSTTWKHFNNAFQACEVW